MNGAGSDKTGVPHDGAGADAQPGSGEGSGTALEALIKKRKLRAEDDAPAASPDPLEPEAPISP